MATYRLKIKTYSLMSGVKNATGSLLTGAGNIAKGAVGKTAGFLGGLGAMGTAAAAGASIAGPIGGLVAGLAAPFVGKKLVSSAGETVKDVGQDMKINAV